MKSERLIGMDWAEGTLRVIGDDEDEHVVVLVSEDGVIVVCGEVNEVKF